MKKAKSSTSHGEYIPKEQFATRHRNSPLGKEPKSGFDFGDMLGKLDGDQLQALGNSLVNLANTGVDLYKEKERTAQAKIHAEQNICLSNNQLKATLEQEYTKRLAIEAKMQKSAADHFNAYNSEHNRHTEIMRILDMVEKKCISSEQLVSLLHVLKSGNNL